MDMEQEIQAAGANVAPRITPAEVEAAIQSEWYINAGDAIVPDGFQPPVPVVHPLHRLIFCVLVLKNGFTVTGESACASPENFSVEIGRKIARENALQKIWSLLGFRLRDRLTAAELIGFDPMAQPLGDPTNCAAPAGIVHDFEVDIKRDA